jgi:hypothetical protein
MCNSSHYLKHTPSYIHGDSTFVMFDYIDIFSLRNVLLMYDIFLLIRLLYKSIKYQFLFVRDRMDQTFNNYHVQIEIYCVQTTRLIRQHNMRKSIIIQNLMFMASYILVIYRYIQLKVRRNAHGFFLCILYLNMLAVPVSGAICTHHQEHKLQSIAVGTCDCYGVLEVG